MVRVPDIEDNPWRTSLFGTRQKTDTVYPSYKRSLGKGRILLSDILGRRQPGDFVREFYPIRGGTL
jgi:hypothetical protein